MSRMLILAAAVALSPISIQPETDADFMKKAAEVGVRDVETSRLAMAKSTNPDVKRFATRVAIDRSIANEELLRLAEIRSVALDPAGLKVDLTLPVAADGRALTPAASQLSNLEGAAFDRAFLEHVITSTAEVIGLFDGTADHSKDQELKDWAERVHQTLQALLNRAKDVRDHLGR